jgi:hypothetical protein
MARSMRLRIGVACSALVLLTGAESDDGSRRDVFAWGELCWAALFEHYAIASTYRFTVMGLNPLKTGKGHDVLLELGPPSDPK